MNQDECAYGDSSVFNSGFFFFFAFECAITQYSGTCGRVGYIRQQMKSCFSKVMCWKQEKCTSVRTLSDSDESWTVITKHPSLTSPVIPVWNLGENVMNRCPPSWSPSTRCCDNTSVEWIQTGSHCPRSGVWRHWVCLRLAEWVTRVERCCVGQGIGVRVGGAGFTARTVMFYRAWLKRQIKSLCKVTSKTPYFQIIHFQRAIFWEHFLTEHKTCWNMLMCWLVNGLLVQVFVILVASAVVPPPFLVIFVYILRMCQAVGAQ